jgi:hypothetical protein
MREIIEFTQPLNIPISSYRRFFIFKKITYLLARDYVLTWIENGIIHEIRVPKGFKYDGASVPQFLWSLTGFTPDGLIRAGALIHDLLYFLGGKLDETYHYTFSPKNGWEGVPLVLSREESDILFREINQKAGLGASSHFIHAGVRVAFWNNRRF